MDNSFPGIHFKQLQQKTPINNDQTFEMKMKGVDIESRHKAFDAWETSLKVISLQ